MQSPVRLPETKEPPVSFEMQRFVSYHLLFPPFLSLEELNVYKIQNLQWTADFSGDVTLTWIRPKKMPSASCVYNVYYRWVPSLPREKKMMFLLPPGIP